MGVDTIDVDYATSLGIPVVVTPGANVRSTAEHTLTVLLTVAKNIVESYEHTRDGDFAIRNKYASVEMLGKTVGVLGYGNIGREIAKLCKALDMKVAIYDPFVSQQRVEDDGYGYYASLEEMLPVCDAVTLHMPATPQTRNIISAERLGLFKKSAFLINCARGDLVEGRAVHALKSGALAGASADMMAVEPMDPKSPLFTLPNFIANPAHGGADAGERGALGHYGRRGHARRNPGRKSGRTCSTKTVYEHKNGAGRLILDYKDKKMIQLNENDNVAVAVEDCIPGQEVAVKAPSSVGDYTVLSVSEIPFGHKCALRDIKAGEIIVKYGRPIGRATADIRKGEVVGVHNIEGMRGRGDKK